MGVPPGRAECDPPPAAKAPRSVEALADRLARFILPSTAIVCVGNDMRGDDGAGPAVAERLAGRVPWKVYDTQTAPENFLMKIIAPGPECVILVDAIAFDAPPGTIGVFNPGDLGGAGPGTHGPAPTLFLESLAMAHPCHIAVLGIRPGRIELGQPLSAPVAAAVTRVVQAFGLLAKWH